MSVGAAIGGIGGAITGGLIGQAGQASANRANRIEAQKNRNFQAQMRSTSYQTGVADLRAAGLNPMLAYSQGGAAQPSGDSARMESETEALASGAKESAMMLAQLKNVQADTELKQANKAKTQGEAKSTDAQGGLLQYLWNKSKPARDKLNQSNTSTAKHKSATYTIKPIQKNPKKTFERKQKAINNRLN